MYILKTDFQNQISPERAFSLSRQLASCGNIMATGHLAYSYANGDGTVPNLEQAYVWFLIATAMAPTKEMRLSLQPDFLSVEKNIPTNQRQKLRTMAQREFDRIRTNTAKRSFVSYVYSIR